MAERDTTFLNVDLDLRASCGLDTLVAAMRSHAFVLNPGQHCEATLEVLTTPSSPEDAIQKLCSAVNSLAPEARRVWDACESKVLNIGIQSGAHPQQSCFMLSANTMAEIAAIKAGLAITVYGSGVTEQ